MSIYQTPEFLTAVLGLIFVLLLGLFFCYQHKQQQRKLIDEYNQLVEQFNHQRDEKNQLEQQLIRVQTQADGLQIRINERDEKIHYLQTELDQEQDNNQQINGQITQLQQHYGSAVAQAKSLQMQLQQQQQQMQRKEQEVVQLNGQLTDFAQQLTGIKTQLIEKEKQFIEQQQMIEQSKQQLSVQFQHLANQILEEKTQRFNQTNQSALDNLLKPFREQIEGFQKRVNEIHSENVKGNANLESEIKKVLEIGLSMSQQADNLTSALKGEKKTLGNWGEIQLEKALQSAGLIENEHYNAQAHFKNEQGQHNYPDFVLNLPDNKHLIIDSKMSLVAYEQAVNSQDDEQREYFLKEHCKALRNHINDLSHKDYSNLIGMRSPDFVLMFLAIEPAYIEALKTDTNLFNYGYERNVILVSHTTLMPILRTVANLWRIERGNLEAREISERAGEIYNQVCLVVERLSSLGDNLNKVSKHYNNTVTALVGGQGLIGKVERFKALSAKANKQMPNLEPIHADIEMEKLTVVRADRE
ncbi:MAG: DNA recombination protein RmuC [Pasteurellaceae bacterium]|nr:DNA recombination protein RmuC [Pasteurellaceae bacterium]